MSAAAAAAYINRVAAPSLRSLPPQVLTVTIVAWQQPAAVAAPSVLCRVIHWLGLFAEGQLRTWLDSTPAQPILPRLKHEVEPRVC